MSGKSTNFDDKKINKSTLYKNKKLFNIHGLDVSFLIMNVMKSLIMNLLTINLKVKIVS